MANPNPSKYPALALLITILPLSLHKMVLTQIQNGFQSLLHTTLASSSPLIPETTTPLRTWYTGFTAFDILMTTSNFIFAHVGDGRVPALSVYMVQFAGQLVPWFAVLMVEGSRTSGSGRKRWWKSAVVWGGLVQMFGYGTLMPVYCILDLGFVDSRERGSLRRRERFGVAGMVGAAVVYVGLTVLGALPVESARHQWLLALWQEFPGYVVLGQIVAARVFGGGKGLSGEEPQKEKEKRDTALITRVYKGAYILAAATQLAVYTTILASKTGFPILPSWMHDPEIGSFRSVFLPRPFSSPLTAKPRLALITSDFFKWDQILGSAGMLIWSISLLRSAGYGEQGWGAWVRLAGRIGWWSVVAGPAGAAVQMLRMREVWQRDQEKKNA
ncbi:hypothetical protein QBC47DRAFT_370420 [Echria macrotheca]|uniref:Uncharacterized protein n=1 Tax=Echria macrotheca TaxID=438768 RepID=A0AAJ0BNS7_9PEZI|nr:hypothetical protein QBC47DRAFT_370420 [Echria macrotheca]